ncbi:SpoIIE family protein phosphatase [Aquihabitans sp. G128]|uniref:SpoIIE family protein phosphatase n=1 Tax=Aquihabitans sp. G128 TaxID=2849779 RepID=UPI001C23BCDB|nr:SpoIIE family protein phosphatase [Aquihabitans sp. G128]QXC61105.1 SpoIIE family protein phosphatase [Aquihabitans sp. G128]
MGALVAAHDWSATPLGHPDGWPAGLRLATQIVLTTRFPMLLAWGPDLVKIYNDGYRPMLGDKHPQALGAPAREIWPEVWDIIGPLLEASLGGATSSFEHQLLELDRNGYLEESYFSFCYSPVRDDDGTVGGVLDVVTETTEQVVNRRRLECVADLAAELVTAHDVAEVGRRAVASLRTCVDDIASAEVHLAVGDQIVQVATSRRAVIDGIAPEDLRGMVGGEPRLLDPTWEEGRPGHRWASPIGAATSAQGVLVVDLSPKRPFDDGYRTYLELIARTIGAAIDHAHTRSAELGEQRRISDALQSAMLQPASDLPTVAARYLPATGNLSVGGDWYDVLGLDDGRRALVVGDCVGHGLEAAAAMGQLRTASRTLLLEGRGPAEVLESMDRFASSVTGAACATMACAVVDLEARSITYALAGHPAPLLAGPGGATWLTEGSGLPLAVVGGQRRCQAVTSFDPDDLLVLYSDGLIERRGEDIDIGFERLRAAAAARLDQSVQQLADGLLDDLLDPEGRDDVALVVKRLATRH